MNDMKRKIIFLLSVLCALFCVLGLAACKSCKDRNDEPVDPEPVPPPEHVHVYSEEVTPPTCTEQGYTTYTCVSGDDSYKDDFVNALGHNYEEVVVPFTCTNDGYTRMVCSRGDSEYTKEGSEVKAHHVYSETVVSPTCTEKGYTDGNCTVCNNSPYKKDYTEYLPHNFEDGACTVCGGTEGLEYELLEGGEAYAVKGLGTAAKTVINVLKVYEGKPVTRVSAHAFENKTELLGVNLPDTVTEIGAYALHGLTGVTRLILPASVERIEDHALSHMSNIEELNLGESLKYLGKYVLENDVKLETIVLPSTLTEIDEYALSHCALKRVLGGANIGSIGAHAFEGIPITEINLPSSLKVIPAYAFSGCNLLETVLFGGEPDGRGVEEIGYGAFLNCEKLGVFGVPKLLKLGESAFSGCKALRTAVLGNTLDIVPAKAFSGCEKLLSFSVPETVSAIGERAFEGCVSLGVINLHDQIKTIGAHAFEDCGALRSVYVPQKLTSLGGYAFKGCDGVSAFAIPETLTAIDESTFADCKSVTEITIPAGVTEIKTNAFAGCVKLFEVFNKSALTIVAGTTDNGRVAENARNVYTPTAGEKKLESVDGFITYPDGGILLGYSGNAESVTLPETVADGEYVVYEYAFYKRNFNEVTIPEGVTEIGKSAFENCASLTKINYNAANCADFVNVNDAFLGCGENMKVTFGGKVERVPDYLFSGITNLKEIAFDEEGEPVTLGSHAFADTRLKKVYLPARLVGSHSTAFKNSDMEELYFNAADLSSSPFTDTELVQTKLTIGKDVQNIYSGIFNGQEYSDITFESGELQTIESDAFKDCSAMIVYISDLDKWRGIAFGNAAANPMCASECLFVNGKELINAELGGSVSNYALYGSSTLETVTITAADATIGIGAFGRCESLSEIDIPKLEGSLADIFGGDEAYSLCKVTIRTGVIADSAFEGFSSDLGFEVYLGEVTAIGANAFKNSALTKIVISDPNASIAENAFSGCVSLTEVVLPEALTAIESGTFFGCTALKEIAIPAGVTAIGTNAFGDCTRLKSVAFGEGSKLLTIGAEAFRNCRNLTSIVIPTGVTSCTGAFEGCTKLWEIYDLSGTVAASDALVVYTSLDAERKIDDRNGFLFYTDAGTDTVYLLGYNGAEKNIVLPENYDGKSYMIRQYAFSYSDGLGSVIISGGVTEIGIGAFLNCAELKSVEIGAGVTTIRTDAFGVCPKLNVSYNGTEEEWRGITVEGDQEALGHINFKK